MRKAYELLKYDMGGSNSEMWTAEVEQLRSEHSGKKAEAGRKLGQSGGDVAKLMEVAQ